MGYWIVAMFSALKMNSLPTRHPLQTPGITTPRVPGVKAVTWNSWRILCFSRPFLHPWTHSLNMSVISFILVWHRTVNLISPPMTFIVVGTQDEVGSAHSLPSYRWSMPSSFSSFSSQNPTRSHWVPMMGWLGSWWRYLVVCATNPWSGTSLVDYFHFLYAQRVASRA